MDVKTTTIGGKVIKYKDVINYTVTNSFTWKQRWKILFGAKAVTHAAIFTMNNKVDLVDTALVTIVGNDKQLAAAQTPAPVKQTPFAVN